MKQNERCNENNLNQVETYSMDQRVYKNDRWLPTIVQLMCLLHLYLGSPTVLRIHDILVWIWIRIRGSMPLTDGSGCGSLSFHHWPSRCQQKKLFILKKFFCILLFEGTLTSFFKHKKSKRSNKTVDIKVFLTIFA